VAFATPWPPKRSRAAASSERLVAGLAEHADVDVLATPADEAFDRSPARGVRVWGIDELDWLLELRDHDGYLYALDADPANAPILEALVRRPGVVLLHDTDLSRIHRERARDRPWADRAGRLALLERTANPSEQVQEHAMTAIVHSEAQLAAASRDRPAGAPEPALIPAEHHAAIAERVIRALELE
jgi:hypothetical protein